MQKFFLFLAVCSVHAQDLDLVSKPEYRRSVINAIDRLQDTNYPHMLARLHTIHKQHDHEFSQLSDRIKILRKQQAQDSFAAKNSSLLTSLAIGLATTAGTFAIKFARKEDDDQLKPIATAALLLGAGAGSLAVITLKIRDAMRARAKHNRHIELQKCLDKSQEMSSETPAQRAVLDKIIIKEMELDQCAQAVCKEWARDSQAIEKGISDIKAQTTKTLQTVYKEWMQDSQAIDKAERDLQAQATTTSFVDNAPTANVKHSAEVSCQVNFSSMHDINIGFGKAVQEGDILKIKMFLDLGANIDQHHKWPHNRFDHPNPSTALYYAVYRGYDAVVELLLQHNANIEIPDKYGYTPLLVATCNNRTIAIELLIKAGANIHTQSCKGETCLYIAAARKNANLIYQLLRRGADASVALKFCIGNHEAEKIFIEEQLAIFKLAKSYEAAQAI